MKIALVRARYDPFGGAEKFVQGAVDALADAGVSLTILTRKWPSQANAAIAHQIINPRYVTSTGRDRGFAHGVQSHIASQRYDLVQSHERIAGCDIYRAGDGVHAEWLTQRARVQTPWQRFTTRMNPHHRYLLRAEREMFTSPKLRAVICNSNMVRQEILRHFQLDESKLVVIHNGVNVERFSLAQRDQNRWDIRRHLKIPVDVPVAIFVGSGFERKGLYWFLKALAAQKEKMFSIVVGRDKHLPRYAHTAAMLGIDKQVHFVGAVTDPRPYYHAADVFCLPTLYEPFSNVVLEAMASGLPVVTSTHNGASEVITPSINGYIVEPMDFEAIARHLNDCAARKDMSGAARATALACTTQSMAKEYIALYKRLLVI